MLVLPSKSRSMSDLKVAPRFNLSEMKINYMLIYFPNKNVGVFNRNPILYKK